MYVLYINPEVLGVKLWIDLQIRRNLNIKSNLIQITLLGALLVLILALTDADIRKRYS